MPNDASKAAGAAAPIEPIDPKKAMSELMGEGGLLEQIQKVWSEGKTWSPEERVERRRAIVETYVRVFAPAMAFSGTQLALTLAAFLVYALALAVSGRGYADVANLCEGVPVLGDAIAGVDPGWGNAAIALVLVEVSAPLLLPLTALATPKATEALQNKLVEWGLDADGLNEKIEATLERTS